MTPEITSKNTKAEILKAYNALVKENQELQGQIEELRKKKAIAAPEKPRAREEKPFTEVVTGATMDDIIQGLGHLQARFGNAISALSAKLTAEAIQLEEVQQDVEAETKGLREVHGFEVTETTLDELIQAYVEKSQGFEEEMNQRRQTFEQEMAEKRKAWKKEQEEHARWVKERDESLKKARQREAAEYKYELERARKQDRDTYEQTREKRDEELEEIAQRKRREWQEREKTIVEQEQLFEEYREKVEVFPKELDAAVQKAVREGRALVESEAKMQADLRAKDVEGEKRIYELRIQALEEAIKKQAAHIDGLSKQLNAVLKQAQDLAVKALEGTASASTYQAVREIALEQAKSPPANE